MENGCLWTTLIAGDLRVRIERGIYTVYALLDALLTRKGPDSDSDGRRTVVQEGILIERRDRAVSDGVHTFVRYCIIITGDCALRGSMDGQPLSTFPFLMINFSDIVRRSEVVYGRCIDRIPRCFAALRIFFNDQSAVHHHYNVSFRVAFPPPYVLRHFMELYYVAVSFNGLGLGGASRHVQWLPLLK